MPAIKPNSGVCKLLACEFARRFFRRARRLIILRSKPDDVLANPKSNLGAIRGHDACCARRREYVERVHRRESIRATHRAATWRYRSNIDGCSLPAHGQCSGSDAPVVGRRLHLERCQRKNPRGQSLAGNRLSAGQRPQRRIGAAAIHHAGSDRRGAVLSQNRASASPRAD